MLLLCLRAPERRPASPSPRYAPTAQSDPRMPSGWPCARPATGGPHPCRRNTHTHAGEGLTDERRAAVMSWCRADDCAPAAGELRCLPVAAPLPRRKPPLVVGCLDQGSDRGDARPRGEDEDVRERLWRSEEAGGGDSSGGAVSSNEGYGQQSCRRRTARRGELLGSRRGQAPVRCGRPRIAQMMTNTL